MRGKPASRKIDRKKSMRQLTRRSWRGDNLAAHLFTDLTAETDTAWKKPLEKLTAGDLFILLSQRASLGKDAAYLLALAVEQVEKDPLALGRSYPGELHTALGFLDGELWADQPDLACRWTATLIAAAANRRSLKAHHRDILDLTLKMACLQHPFVDAAVKAPKKKLKR
jgi:hypothetical protein